VTNTVVEKIVQAKSSSLNWIKAWTLQTKLNCWRLYEFRGKYELWNRSYFVGP